MTNPPSEIRDPDTKAFFHRLASRLRTENPLSDITYTALDIIPSFKADFIRFFYADIPVDGSIDMTREQWLPSASGRPDFVFRAGRWNLIMENKIWDKHYHWDEYENHGYEPHSQTYLALISCRKDIPPRQGWSIRTWEHFVRAFENKTYGSCTSIFSGYISYVKRTFIHV